MSWEKEIDLDNCVIIPARFGGPIAMIRDRNKRVKMGLHGIGKPIIAIYTSAGRFISKFVCDKDQLVQLGWSSTENLLCIQENGQVLIYNMFGEYVHAFSMGKEVEDTKVVSAQVFHTNNGTGICVLTGAYRIFLTNTIKDPKVRKLAELPGIMEVPNSWAVIYEERSTYVLFSKSTEMYCISDSQVILKNINKDGEERGSIITDIAVSPDYEQVALYNSQEQIWIGSSDLRKNYRIFDMRGSGRPKQLLWCGSEAVVGYWDDTISIIGRESDSITYVYYSSIVLSSEIDCIRVLSALQTDLIQLVPSVIMDIYRIDSTSPGSYLLSASKQFQKKSHRANEYLHLVRPNLQIAVEQCVEGAGCEFNPDHQKMLLKAAQFGKTFLEDFNSEMFVKMCRTLRVLNAIRHPKIGILLTYNQFKHLSISTVIDRLILRRQYYLAIQAANYMRLSNKEGASRILEHWAYYKIAQLSTDKEQIAEDIAKKLGNESGVSYIDIARHAVKRGRNKLAVKKIIIVPTARLAQSTFNPKKEIFKRQKKFFIEPVENLIDYEPRSSLQVSMLLDLEKYEKALEKAVESGNTDLINIVILNMQKEMFLKDFQLEVRKDAVVYSLYKKYCREHNKEALINIYKQEDDHNEIAACSLRYAYSPENYSTRSSLLEAAKESYKKGRNEVNTILCAEQRKLLQKQKELEEQFNREFVDLPLFDTIYKLLIMKEIKIAEDLRSAFKISDRRFWWLRIESLAELGDWTELDRISKIKKPPFGFEPFLDICLKHENRAEAMKYIPRIRPEYKVKYLVKLSLFMDAIKVAESQRDVSALNYIQSNCDATSKLEVSSALARLKSNNK